MKALQCNTLYFHANSNAITCEQSLANKNNTLLIDEVIEIRWRVTRILIILLVFPTKGKLFEIILHRSNWKLSYMLKSSLKVLLLAILALIGEWLLDGWSNAKKFRPKQLKRREMTRKGSLEGGRKPLSSELESLVLEWVLDRRLQGLRVSRTLIRKKAAILFKEIEDTSESEFSASKGWCEKFMRRNGLSLRRKTSVCQKDPDMVIAKLVAYVLRIRRLRLQHNYALNNIYAMDETPVWCDMVSTSTVDKTGSKNVHLKSKGHEKSCVTVCLTAKASGGKNEAFYRF